MMQDENTHIVLKGIVGAGTNVLALITSMQAEFEYWVRITSLSIGIAVGCLTLISLVRNLRKK